MNPETAAPATRSAATPPLEVSLEDVGPFLRAVGLAFDEISAVRVTGRLELGLSTTPRGGLCTAVSTRLRSRLRLVSVQASRSAIRVRSPSA